tara:strand:- start:1317 stop:2585 length:1269 start_codon:yes stop_codon:yes gene_type:complete
MSFLGKLSDVLAEVPLPPNLNAGPLALKIYQEYILPNLSDEEKERFDPNADSLSQVEQGTDPQQGNSGGRGAAEIAEWLEGRVADGQMTPEEAQALLMGAVPPASPPRNEALITDIEFVNQPGGGDIVSTGFDPLGRGGSMFMQGVVPAGTLGLKDQPYFGVFAPGFSLESDELMIGTATKIDRDMEQKGFEFRRMVEEDRPFTIKDGLDLYDQQSSRAQRLIAESLVPTMMKDPNLRKLIMSTPELIYDRDSVFIALSTIQEDAALQASLLKDHPMSTGFETLDMIPALTEAELGFEDPWDSGQFGEHRRAMSMKDLTDYLFDEAVALGAVKTVTKEYSDALAESVYRELTGRAPDEAFFVLADTWTREVQMDKGMSGQGAASQAEYSARYASGIEEEYADEIAETNQRTARSSLLRAMQR